MLRMRPALPSSEPEGLTAFQNLCLPLNAQLWLFLACWFTLTTPDKQF